MFPTSELTEPVPYAGAEGGALLLSADLLTTVTICCGSMFVFSSDVALKPK